MTGADKIRKKYNLPPGCPVQSPWGGVDHGDHLGDGMFSVSTPSHGGILVPTKLNNLIPEIFRITNNLTKTGWYEEDSDCAIPMFFLPTYFTEDSKERARKSLRCWFWKQWEEHFKEVIPENESHQKADHIFKESHKNSLLTVTAFGDWHPKVPKGMVGVGAILGGDRQKHNETKWFLVTKEEYVSNATGSIIIDPKRHETWVGPT